MGSGERCKLLSRIRAGRGIQGGAPTASAFACILRCENRRWCWPFSAVVSRVRILTSCLSAFCIVHWIGRLCDYDKKVWVSADS